MKEKHILKNILITIVILALAAVFCFWLQGLSESDTHVPLLFVLAVVLVSRFTEGYAYGILASMIAVIGVNYVFTYPYFEINFNLTGYPLTFLAMLAVAVLVSALTTQIKEKEQIRLEVEREKMRGNLLRAVSHDIRTPLTSIVGAASLLLDNEKELSREQKIEFVQDIRLEAQWLIRIVE
ncbi:MAG: PAS domain-containing sensor histidine kinase, partial [Lachnospiraceae bacterium]|nr:PAS domain-containing sensor histidine kinase [Lachnospiraceae bacterium]